MGIQLAHNKRILKIALKKFFFCILNLLRQICFFSQCPLRKVGVTPSWSCHTLVCLTPNSWDQELSADVSFVTVLATILSEYWKKLEEIFFWNDITWRRLWKLYHFEKNSQAFFNILTEPLLVQKQMIHQQKAWDLSNLEPERKGRGMVRRVPRPLAAKDIEKKK